MNGYKWIIGLFVALLPVLGVAQCDDNNPPTGSISVSEVGCGGSQVTITFSLSGDDDEFDVVYRIGGSTFTLQNIRDGHMVTHFVSASTTATLVSVTERDDDDDDECTSTINQTIPITVPLPPNLSVSSNNPGCNQNNGSITVQASGGQSPYQFRLNSGAFQSNGTFSNLGAGSYTITVRDANGCEATQSVNLTASAAPNLTISNTSQPGCNQNNGSITVQASGGQSPYQFRLNSGAFQSNGTFSNLGAGSYTITVRDASGCEASRSVDLTSGTAPNLTISNASQPGCNQNNGSITVQASGGQSPYQFRLNSGAFQSNGTFSNLGAGSYTITVRDASGCEASRSVDLTSGTAPNLTISNTSQPGCNQDNGSITVQASGGQSPYQFRLNSGAFQSNGTFSNLSAGSYTITVRDANGCEATQSVTLQNPAGGLAAANITSGDIELCPGASRIVTGNLPAGATGRWTADSEAVRFTNANNRSTTVTTTQSGTYILTWTLSAPGCADYSSASVELTVLSVPVAENDGIFEIKIDTSLELLVLSNDEWDGNVQLSILAPPNKGTAQVIGNNRVRYETIAGALGEDEFRYKICLLQCPTLCDTATVSLIIVEEEGICNLEKIDPRVIFPEGITPNGDGYNETLEFKIVDKIGCPTNYAQSDISIFNRWGDRVFYQEPYENGWNGTTDDGKKLPPGVYYYTLRVRRSGKKDYIRFGNVTIFRQ